MDTLDREIALRFCQLRQQKGYSQEFVESATGISVKSISDIENGRRNFRATTLLSLCALYGVTTDYIFMGTDDVLEHIRFLTAKMDQQQKEAVVNILEILLTNFQYPTS